LLGPSFNLINQCNVTLSFNYHMHGASMGSLALEVSTDGGATWSSIWTRSGTQGIDWLQASIDLTSYSGTLLKIRFVGIIGTGNQSDIAIDNVIVVYSDTKTVTTTQTWSDDCTLCGNLEIQNGATLTISGTTHMPHQSNITLRNNSVLIVDGGKIVNSNITVESGGKLVIRNNGVINRNADEEITINVGGLLDFNNGEILTEE
jgi:hypothetical protein